MKKIFSFFLIFVIILTLVACSNKEENPTNSETPSTNSTEATLPSETTPDNGKVEYEKEYTMKEILEIKTNWNAKYAFPCDADKVVIESETDTTIKMSLTTRNSSFEETISFYDKYTANKEKKNKTLTSETCLFTFEEDYVARTVMIVKNKDNVVITIEYSMDIVNKH